MKLLPQNKSAIQILKETNQLSRFIIMIVLIGVIFLTVSLVQKQQRYQADASTHQANVVFVSGSEPLPPDKQLIIFIDPQSTPLVFAHLEINFDTQLIQLVNSIFPSDVLNRTVFLTPIEEANTTGKLVIVLAGDPRDPVPSKAFQLTTLHFSTITTDSLTTQITINTDSSLLVAQDEKPFTIIAESVILSLNSVADPSSTPTTSDTPSTDNQEPFFVTKRLSIAKANKSYSKSIIVADKDLDDVLFMESSSLISGLTLTNCQTTTNQKKKRLELTCYLKGTPTTKGSYQINITTLDSEQASVTKTFTLNVR